MIKVTRIGFVNFWLYDDEEFDFYDGKLLLRGHNGSGKSVTMQSFIPLILDGNKAPSRLDPFGTTDKHIEDYLLGGIDTDRKEEATAYLYMETYHEEKKKYITIGMGLHARIGRPVDFYGFAIQDGRRIGKDILLYEKHGEKVPLTKQQLKLELGPENIIVESTKDYKNMVNKLLFGFPSLDMYDEFINVLLQLRSPKLSKDYKPTKLMSILSGVLQPLTEDDLRPLSDAIEDMDKTKEKIEKLENDSKQISYFLKTFNNYNEILLYQKAKNYMDSEKKYGEVLQNLKENERQVESKKQDLEVAIKENADLEVEEERVRRRKENIDDKDLNSKTEKRNTLERELQSDSQRQEKLELEISNKKEKEIEKQNLIKQLEDEMYQFEKNSLELIKEVEELCEEVKFNEPSIALKDLKQDLNTKIDFPYLEIRIKKHQQIIKTIKDKLAHKKEKEYALNQVEETIAKHTKDYQEILSKIEVQEEKLEGMLGDIKDSIIRFNKENQYIQITEEEQKEMFTYLKLYDKKSFKLAKNLYEKIADHFLEQARNERDRLIEKQSLQKNQKEQLQQQLDKIKQQEEEEILLDEDETKTKEYLDTSKIPYLEFYKAIDFKEELSSSKKDELEQTLLNSGILAAKIIHKQDITKLNGHKGVFLCASTKKKKNLTTYLVPVKNISFSKEEITAILESISMDELDTLYLNEDTFRMDYLYGFSSDNIPSKYIGVLKRKEEKLRQIKIQEEKIKEATTLLNTIENLIASKNEEIKTIEEERKRFPSEESLIMEDIERDKLIYESERIAKEKSVEEEKLQKISQELEQLEKELVSLKKDIFLPLSYETFEDALETMGRLMEILPKLMKEVTLYQKHRELEESYHGQVEEIRQDINDIYEQLHELSQNIKKNQAEKEDLDALLNSDKYKDIAAELLRINEQLDSIPKKRIDLVTNIGALKEIIRNGEEKTHQLQQELEEKENLKKLFATFFTDEYNLHYVEKEEKENTLDLAKSVLTKLASRKDSDMKNAEQNYYSAFNEYRLNLNDYNLTQIEIFDKIPETTPYLEYYQNNRRPDIRAMYQGKKLNLYELSTTLMDAIEENHLILTEQDTHLFQEILLKSIGNKIKERIVSSEEWVKQINDVMSSMQKNSALSFGLIWKSKDAETMEEMDTKELVRIFKAPSGMGLASDAEKLIKHFRSKLQRAMEYSGDTANYANVIFDILDYRNWFEFKMTYQRTGDPKKELTDKVFSVFSGGEKAKTMYIPLFAAVSAKLNGANPHTLRLVALDEAFAGVDELNIKEMFGILDSLKLDYILTSQSLTGDYDTIKELAIAELLRPNNSQVVGIRRKKWNGKNMEIVLRKEITKDAVGLL